MEAPQLSPWLVSLGVVHLLESAAGLRGSGTWGPGRLMTSSLHLCVLWDQRTGVGRKSPGCLLIHEKAGCGRPTADLGVAESAEVCVPWCVRVCYMCRRVHSCTCVLLCVTGAGVCVCTCILVCAHVCVL